MRFLKFLIVLIMTCIVQIRSDYASENAVSAVGGKITAALSKITVNKCCPEDQYFDVNFLICVNFRNSQDLFTKFVTLPNNGRNFEYKTFFPNCSNKQVLSSIKTTKVQYTADGYVVADGNAVMGSHCVDWNQNEAVVVTCRDSGNRPRLRKCCPIGTIFDVAQQRGKCVNATVPFAPVFYDLQTKTIDIRVSVSSFDLQFGKTCGEMFRLVPEESSSDANYLAANGTLFLPEMPPGKKYYTENQFCIETLRNQTTTSTYSYLCDMPEFNSTNLVIVPCMMVSSICLLATFLVYLFLPKLRQIHGKMLMCFVASLFVAYVGLIVTTLDPSGMDQISCIVTGYLIFFTTLSAFAWLNVMSFDIWRTIRAVNAVNMRTKREERIRFARYSAYAWGAPLAITLTCLIVDMVPESPSSIKPDFGGEKCWFSPKTYAIYIFFISPISIVIISNIYMYVTTAWRYWKVKSEINRMENQSRKKSTANNDQFKLTAKLFIVMGVTWSLEIISFLFPHPIWLYLSDLPNALHGVFILAIFILKRKTLHLVADRMGGLLQKFKHRKRTTSSRSTLTTNTNVSTNTDAKTKSNPNSVRISSLSVIDTMSANTDQVLSQAV